jgi:3-oxoacyl-[acyl-carrier-protein] synthase III
MFRSRIAGIGSYVPKQVVTNNDLIKYMDTSDEWIQERTGIKERRFADRTGETTTTMGVEAAKIAIERAGITAQDIDFIVIRYAFPRLLFPGLWCIAAKSYEDEGNWRVGRTQSMQRICICIECGRSIHQNRYV